MIIATLEELYQQIPNLPRLKQGLDALVQLRGQNLADGRYQVDGDSLYVLVQSYETIPNEEDAKYEAHRKYIDVQYIVEGLEGMGWAPLAELAVNKAYNEEKDVVLGTCPPAAATLVRVAPGQAAIFFPQDAHAPKLAVGSPCPVRKIVVKVAV